MAELKYFKGGVQPIQLANVELVQATVELERYLIRHPERAKQNGGDNCVELPFQCGMCKRSRFDLQMIDGDGYPMCIECFESFVTAIGG